MEHMDDNFKGGISIKHTPAMGKIVPDHNHIKIVFPNRYTVSIVYGAAVYSTNRVGSRFDPTILSDDYATSVEVAILNPDGNFVPFKDGESVKGFVPLTELFTILNWVSTR